MVFSSNFLSFSFIFFFLSCFFACAYALGDSRIFVDVSSLLPSDDCTSSAQGIKEKGSSLKVVHKYGPCNKHDQDKSMGSLDHIQILLHDQSRVDSIHSRIYNSGKDSIYDLAATTVPVKSGAVVNSGNYIVTVGLGSPKKDLSLVFDTGSPLTWTQCQPCARYCYKQNDPIFAPSQSASYANITCNSPTCKLLESATGKTPGCSVSACVYGILYGDQSFSVGLFATDKLTLGSSDVFDKFYFGCGQNNQGLFRGTAGLLGLSQANISFVSQTAQKYGQYFSYCLPSKPSLTGHLTFGKDSQVSRSLKFTPLVERADRRIKLYYLDTLGISVGGKKLSIPPSTFSNSGTLIDSGTVISRLPPTAYAALRSTFRQLMSKYTLTQPFLILDTCYDLSGVKYATIPTISFFFGGGVEMPLGIPGILYVPKLSQVCLAFAPNSDDSSALVFGNVQQLTYDVVYDVAGGRIGFGAGGCS